MRLDPKEIFEQVKANRNKLDSCDKHDFSIDLSPERKIGKEWECSNCGGKVDSPEKVWYEKGLEHGAK